MTEDEIAHGEFLASRDADLERACCYIENAARGLTEELGVEPESDRIRSALAALARALQAIEAAR